MQVPLFDNTRQFQALRESLMSSVERVLVSGKYILGPDVQLFEREAAEYLGVKHAIGVASGTDALWLALKALGIGPNDYVLTTPFTFFATASAVLNTGARPAFADIDPDSFNLDIEQVRLLLEGRSETNKRLGIRPDSIRAIIPVHLYGQAADMDQMMALAEEYGLFVVEDAAQAFGAEYKGQGVGGFGDFGCFSFFPTKTLGGFGDGGLVVTNSDELAEQVRLLRAHGSRRKYYHQVWGGNSRLDTIQATLLRVKLRYLDSWIETRQSHAAAFDNGLKDLTCLVRPYRAPNRTHTYHQYTIRVPGNQRDSLQNFLRERGVGTEVYYPLPVHLQSVMLPEGYQIGDFPNAEQLSGEVLSLPVFPEMRVEERDFVIGSIRDSFSASGGVS
jgi:dTDP-4-amino-4,6-dideoxygalactose transaminase